MHHSPSARSPVCRLHREPRIGQYYKANPPIFFQPEPCRNVQTRRANPTNMSLFGFPGGLPSGCERFSPTKNLLIANSSFGIERGAHRPFPRYQLPNAQWPIFSKNYITTVNKYVVQAPNNAKMSNGFSEPQKFLSPKKSDFLMRRGQEVFQKNKSGRHAENIRLSKQIKSIHWSSSSDFIFRKKVLELIDTFNENAN